MESHAGTLFMHAKIGAWLRRKEKIVCEFGYFNEPMIAAIPEIPPKATSAITKTIAKRM